MLQPQHASEGAPEWMVSYADMITIMMAFFVVLYASTSSSSGGGNTTQKDPKKTPRQASAADERMQKVIESVYYRFGPEWTITNCWTGGPPELRDHRDDSAKGKKIVTHSVTLPGSEAGKTGFRIRTLRAQETISTGARVYFDDDSAVLSDAQKKTLSALAQELVGKAQKVEIRGHTSRRPLPSGSPFHDHFDLAYARARAVREYLVSQKIDPRRLRVAVAGENEPPLADGDALQSARVEVHMLNEYVQEPSETQRTSDIP